MTEAEYYKELDSWITTIRKIHGMIRYYLKVEPYSMENWEWANRYVELEWLRKEENKGQHG